MKNLIIFVSTGVATVLAVLATSLVTATPAQADIDKSGRCAGATYELNVERTNNRFDIDADLDDAKAGSVWRIALRHDGKVFTRVVRTADNEGEISIDRYRANTKGTDTFRLTITKLSTGKVCTTKIVTR